MIVETRNRTGLQIAGRTDLQRDVSLMQQSEDLDIVDGLDPMADAVSAHDQDRVADVRRRAHFPRMDGQEKPLLPGPPENRDQIPCGRLKLIPRQIQRHHSPGAIGDGQTGDLPGQLRIFPPHNGQDHAHLNVELMRGLLHTLQNPFNNLLQLKTLSLGERRGVKTKLQIANMIQSGVGDCFISHSADGLLAGVKQTKKSETGKEAVEIRGLANGEPNEGLQLRRPQM